MSQITFSENSDGALPLYAVSPDTVTAWRDTAPAHHAAWADARDFNAAFGACLALPGPDGRVEAALVGLGTENERKRKRFALGAARPRLPALTWRLEAPGELPDIEAECLGWLISGYRFGAYRSGGDGRELARLVAPEGIDRDALEAIAAGEHLIRDLINTPANDLGPAELAGAASDLGARYDARVDVTEGDTLLDRNFPLIHTVGAASSRAPRLIELNWGDRGPKLTLVGKGVCFDTGGLNLKPGGSMGLMKKDMGGAANVLGLARMIMETGLAVRLRVLVPAVENAVGGNAFRPGDILTSRAGLTVEINNTDAEGRLVLADALALAAEDEPDLIVSMATLTGAARVAVGPDIAPFYTGDDELARQLAVASDAVKDPVWRMPFWDPYESMIEPGVADLDNAPKGGFAGSIIAALFLRRFVRDPARYLHFDIFGWQPTDATARPKGGVGQGARALLATLPGALGL